MNMAGAFEPTDVEIASFLSRRQVPPLEPQKWLEADLVEPEKGGEEEQKAEGGMQIEDRIRELVKDGGLSMTGIVRAVWGSGAGDAFAWRSELVKKIISEGVS
jgi:hypothetical protein